MELYTDGNTPATEDEGRNFVATFSKSAIDAWIATNAPKLKTVIDANEIVISAEEDATKGVNNVMIFFNIAGTTNDRKRVLAMGAQVLHEFMRGKPTEVTDTYTVEKQNAQNWARWTEALL